MSVRVMAWVWENSQSEPMDRLVLLAIADCANDTGAEAYPSMATLTRKTGLHERSIQRGLKRLAALGELVVYPNAGPKACNRYRIKMTPGTESPPAERRGGTQPPRQETTPAESRATPGTPPPTPRQSAALTPGTPPPEPSLNHPLTILEPSVGTAGTIVAEWIAHCTKRPPKVVVGQMAKQIAALLEEGFDPVEIKRGIAQWMSKDLHPSTLPSIVNAVVNVRASPAKRSTTDSRVDQALALAAELERKEIES